MKNERAIELLNQVVEHVSVANNTNTTVEELMKMGFEKDELVNDFNFSKSDVDSVDGNDTQEEVFSTCDGWSNGYSSLMIIGATSEQVINRAKEMPDWEYTFYNYDDSTESKCIQLDAYKKLPQNMCDFFGSIGEDVIVYGSWHWDGDLFSFRKNNSDYHGFTASFENDTPRESDEYADDYCRFDVEVLIHDINTGCEIHVGGGMCTEEEKVFYEELVKSHTCEDVSQD